MKTRVLVFCLLFSCIAGLNVNAQVRFNAGVHGGFNMNRIPGFSNFGIYKLGLTGGAIINGSDGYCNNIQLEINYTQKGAIHRKDSIIPYSGRIDLAYLEFVLLYQYDDLDFFGDAAYEVGACYGIPYKKDMTIGNSWVDMDREHFRFYDISIVNGIAWHLGNHFLFRIRYQISVLPVLYRNEMPWSYRKIVLFRGHNTGFHFSLVFMLRRYYE